MISFKRNNGTINQQVKLCPKIVNTDNSLYQKDIEAQMRANIKTMFL